MVLVEGVELPPGAVPPPVQGRVQGGDARVRVLLVWAGGPRHVQDLGVVPLPCLPLSQLPGLSLDPGRGREVWLLQVNVLGFEKGFMYVNSRFTF